jgi:DNA adenine methylase
VDRQALKPPFAYYGGKTTLAPRIAELLPAHEHYVEPFAGSLAVLLAKKPSRAETVNDLDGDLVTFWRVLRDRPDELERVCSLTPHSRAEYLLAESDMRASDELEHARRVWVRLTQGRTNSLREKPGWRLRQDASRGTAMPNTVKGYARRISEVAERLQLVTIEHRDALDLIADYGRYSSACIYADPPYLGSTRERSYAHEMTADGEHEAFAKVCRDAKAPIVVSGYDSPLYDELFDGWHRLEMKAPTTLSGDTDRVEVLWSNRPIGEPDLFSEMGA